MSNYNPPRSDLSQNSRPEKRRELLGKVLSYFSVFSIILVSGLVSFFLGMAATFERVNQSGIADPKMMAAGISQSLVPVVLTSLMSIPSVLAIFIAIFFTSYRNKYFFWFWVFIAVLLILSIPVGTVFGLALSIMLFLKRREFKGKINQISSFET